MWPYLDNAATTYPKPSAIWPSVGYFNTAEEIDTFLTAVSGK